MNHLKDKSLKKTYINLTIGAGVNLGVNGPSLSIMDYGVMKIPV